MMIGCGFFHRRGSGRSRLRFPRRAAKLRGRTYPSVVVILAVVDLVGVPRLERGLRADGHLFRRARIRSEESGDVRARSGDSAAEVCRVRTPNVRALRRRKGRAGRAATTSRRASKWRRDRAAGIFLKRRRRKTSTRRALSTLNNGRILLALPLRSARWRHPSGRRGRARGTRWTPANGRRCATSRRSSRLSSRGRSRGPLNARDEKAPSGMSPLPLGFRRGSPRERRHARGHPRRGRPRRVRARRRRLRPATACVASRTPRGRPRRRRPPRPPHPRAPTEAARGARAGRRNWGSCSTGSGVPCSRWPPPRRWCAPVARPYASARRRPGRRPRRAHPPVRRILTPTILTPSSPSSTRANPRWTPEPARIASAADSWTTRLLVRVNRGRS